MNNKFIYASIASSVAAFLLGWLLFGVFLMDYYKANAIVYTGLMKDPPVIWAIYVGNLCSGILLTYIFQKWANIRSFSSGFMAGLIISFFIALSFDISFYAFMHLYRLRVLAIDCIVSTLIGGAMGGVAGWVLGTGKKSA